MRELFYMSLFLSPFFIIAGVFLIVAFKFRPQLMKEHNSIETYGLLKCYRANFYHKKGYLIYSKDYVHNINHNLLPVMIVDIDGEKVEIEAEVVNKKLSKKDVGKRFKVRYLKKRNGKIALVVDMDNAIKRYNRKEIIGFIIALFVASIFITLGVVLSFLAI